MPDLETRPSRYTRGARREGLVLWYYCRILHVQYMYTRPCRRAPRVYLLGLVSRFGIYLDQAFFSYAASLVVGTVYYK